MISQFRSLGCYCMLGDTHPHTLESLNSLIQLYEALNKPEKAKECQAKLTQIEDFEG